MLAALAPVLGALGGGGGSGGGIGGALSGGALGGSPSSATGDIKTGVQVNIGNPVPMGSDPFTSLFGGGGPGFRQSPSLAGVALVVVLLGGAVFLVARRK